MSVYVRDMRRKWQVGPSGKGRSARKWTPVTYGPFETAEQAEMWREQRGTIHMQIVNEREADNIVPMNARN